jgi:hypothetical protein
MNTLICTEFNAGAVTDLVAMKRMPGALHCRFNGASAKLDGFYTQDSLASACPDFLRSWLRMEAIPDTTPDSDEYRVEMAKSYMQESPRRWLLLQNQRRIAGCEWEALEFTTADPKVRGWQPTVGLQLKMLKPDGSSGPCQQVTSWVVLEANFPGCTEILQKMTVWKLSPNAMADAIRKKYMAMDVTLEQLGVKPRSLASLDQTECLRDAGSWVAIKWSAVMKCFTISRVGRERGMLLATTVPGTTADAMYPGFTAQFQAYQGLGMSAGEIIGGMRSFGQCCRETRSADADVGISIA